MISIQSYIGTFMMMNLLMGIVFELSVLCWLLGRLGLLDSTIMRRFRKHAIVAILIIAAINIRYIHTYAGCIANLVVV